MNFKLKARINPSDAQTIRHALGQLPAKGSLRREGDEFLVEAQMEGASAKELNRTLLSALRKVEKRTTTRAEWSYGDTTERYFDYVLKEDKQEMTPPMRDPSGEVWVSSSHLLRRPELRPPCSLCCANPLPSGG
jgi:hypothetical protein